MTSHDLTLLRRGFGGRNTSPNGGFGGRPPDSGFSVDYWKVDKVNTSLTFHQCSTAIDGGGYLTRSIELLDVRDIHRLGRF